MNKQVKVKKSYRFTDQTQRNIEVLLNLENKERERVGAVTKITETELIEKAIETYTALRLEHENGDIISAEIRGQLSKQIRDIIREFMGAINQIHYDILFTAGMLRVILNSVDDGTMTDEERIQLLNKVSYFEELIQNDLQTTSELEEQMTQK